MGEKTAAQLLQQFGSIDALYERLDEVKSEKRRALLAEHEADARLSKRLATMVLDVPLEEDLVELVARGGYALPVESVDAVFEKYEFAQPAAAPARGRGRAREARPRRWPRRLRAAARKRPGRVCASRTRPTSAPWPRRSNAARRPWRSSRPTAREGYAVAVHSGGEAVQVAATAAPRLPALWLLAAHAVVHDAKAQPGYAAAPGGPAFDTAVAAYLLAPELPEKERDLFALSGAADGALLVEGPRAEAEAATRAALTWRLAEAQRPRLLELGLERLFREIELPLVHVLARMEAAGVKMDPYRLGEITARAARPRRRGARRDLRAGRRRVHHRLAAAARRGALRAPRPGAGKKGKTGYSTDARVLRGLREQHPIVPLIEEWRELTKLLNTYLEPLPAHIDPGTGRVHSTFKQTVAATGRLSSVDPNLQNIPVRTDLGAEIRACFVAEEGCKLVVGGLLADRAAPHGVPLAEPALLDAYHRGEDVHRVTAAAVAGIPVEEVTKRQRERAKATNFGIMYGLSAFGLSEQVDIPVDEARAFIDAYFEKYPRVREFRERVIAQAAQDGYVTTLFGRRRAVPELRSSNFRLRSLGERLAVNTVLQGTAADIIKVAMVAVSRELARRKLGSRLVLQVHDELMLESPDAEVEEASALLHDAMCGAYVMDPALEAEVGVGADWLAAKGG